MDHLNCEVSRRELLRTGTVLTAAAAGFSSVPAFAAEEKDGGKPVLPKRLLGKRTGVEVTMLNQGTSMSLSNRLLNTTWAEGVRYFDLAEGYDGKKAEKIAGEWLADTGRRKEIFIVTKDKPHSPEEWIQMVDRRLERIQIDQLDAFFIHGVGGGGRGGDNGASGIPNSKEWAQAADHMKKAGKIKFAGFSTHCNMDLRTELLNQAAEGWPDLLMVAQDPSLVRENKEFNKALDKCHKAGIGLVSMKEMRGLETIPNVIPEFEKLGLSKYAAVLSAVWSDERFASICSSMRSVSVIRENATSARNFKPLPPDKIALITDVLQRQPKTFCAGCTGQCSEAAGKQVAFSDIARYLNYYEADGARDEARELFQALPAELRDWRGADLKAASQACVSKLAFEDILNRAAQKLA